MITLFGLLSATIIIGIIVSDNNYHIWIIVSTLLSGTIIIEIIVSDNNYRMWIIVSNNNYKPGIP
jgi:hypothetical protein